MAIVWIIGPPAQSLSPAGRRICLHRCYSGRVPDSDSDMRQIPGSRSRWCRSLSSVAQASALRGGSSQISTSFVSRLNPWSITPWHSRQCRRATNARTTTTKKTTLSWHAKIASTVWREGQDKQVAQAETGFFISREKRTPTRGRYAQRRSGWRTRDATRPRGGPGQCSWARAGASG